MTVSMESISKMIFMLPSSSAQDIPMMDAPISTLFFVPHPKGEVNSRIRFSS